MAQPFKAPSGVYYIRRKVPDDLRSALGREYKRSLQTRDPNEAKRLFALEWESSESLFAVAKAQKAGAASLTHRDMRVLAQSWHDAELAQMEASGDFARWLAEGGQVTIEHGDRRGQCLITSSHLYSQAKRCVLPSILGARIQLVS